MNKKLVIFFILVSIIATAIYLKFNQYDKSLSDAITNVMFIRFALLDYAQKHNGTFPTGKSSTEVFQQLIDDHDLTASGVFFEMPGKEEAPGNKLSPSNVCFDFTKGADMHSPDWLPIIIPTGYSINYANGEAVNLPSNKVNDDVIAVAYAKSIHDWPIYMFNVLPIKRDRIFIMPGKPADAKVDQYQQLTP